MNRKRTQFKISPKEALKHSSPSLPGKACCAVYIQQIEFKTLEEMEKNKDQAIIRVRHKLAQNSEDFEPREVPIDERLRRIRERAIQLFVKHEADITTGDIPHAGWGENGISGVCQTVCGHIACNLLALIDGYLANPDTTAPSQLVEIGHLSCLVEVANSQGTLSYGSPPR